MSEQDKTDWTGLPEVILAIFCLGIASLAVNLGAWGAAVWAGGFFFISLAYALVLILDSMFGETNG